MKCVNCGLHPAKLKWGNKYCGYCKDAYINELKDQDLHNDSSMDVDFSVINIVQQNFIFNIGNDQTITHDKSLVVYKPTHRSTLKKMEFHKFDSAIEQRKETRRKMIQAKRNH